MAELPETILGQLEYFEQHIPVWAADPAAIGLDAQQIMDITTLTGTMRLAYNDAQAARAESKSMTVLQREALGSMLGLGTALIATIKAFADSTGNSPAVYAAAQIDPSNVPAPIAPPAVATGFVTTLANSGAIELSWKGTTANGTYYTVWRKLNTESNFSIIGNASGRTFTDATIPGGTPSAIYYLITHRDTLSSGESEHVSVMLGVGSGSINTGGESSGESSGSLGLAA